MLRHGVEVLCAWLLVLVGVVAAAAATPYVFTNLGGLLPSQSYGYAMSPNGAVVGGYGTGATTMNTFLYSGGTMNTLSNGAYGCSIGYGANANGQVTGVVTGASGVLYDPAFWSSTSAAPINLGLLPGAGGNGYGYATGISNSGQVVGYCSASGGNMHAFLWTSAGGMVDLGTGGGTTSHATAIDAVTGQIVGTANGGAASSAPATRGP